MAIRTIFSTVEDCAQGTYQGWCEFVRDYAPLAHRLLSHYFPSLRPEIDSAVVAVFAAANANDNAWFKSLHFANEREFAMAFRDLVFASGRSAARLPAPKIPSQRIVALLDGLSLVQRQLFWEFFKGWTVQEAAEMLMNASATAGETGKIAEERLAPFGDAAERAALVLFGIETAQSERGNDCLPWKTFNNLINGQISWADRESAERHISTCTHCLEAFTAFQEMIWLQKGSTALDKAATQTIVGALGVRRTASRNLLGRLFSRAS